jgi:hypothetical protein
MDCTGRKRQKKFIDTPVKRYSAGMYVCLAFAVAAHLDPRDPPRHPRTRAQVPNKHSTGGMPGRYTSLKEDQIEDEFDPSSKKKEFIWLRQR